MSADPRLSFHELHEPVEEHHVGGTLHEGRPKLEYEICLQRSSVPFFVHHGFSFKAVSPFRFHFPAL